MNLRNFLHGSSNGIRTNVLPYVTQQLGLFSRNSQICGSSATYRSTVPLFKSSNQMFYAPQSILRPLSRIPSLGAVVSTRPNTYITNSNYDSDFYSSSRAKGKVTVNFKKISRQSLLHTITQRKILCFLEVKTTSIAATKTNAPETDLRSVALLAKSASTYTNVPTSTVMSCCPV